MTTRHQQRYVRRHGHDLSIGLTPMPREVRDAFWPVLRQVMHLVPRWCAHIGVHWDGRDNENVMTIKADYKYRQASICICNGFLEASDHHRLHHLRHELSHITLAPLEDFIDGLLKKLSADDGGDDQMIRHNYEVAMESVVEDFADILTIAHTPRLRTTEVTR